MKKFFTIALAASMMLAGTSAFAQVSVGAGYLNSTNKTTISSSSTTSLPANGFYAGAEYNITEGKGFGISVGAYYSYITSTASTGASILGVQIGASSKVEEMYLDVPVRFNLSTELGSSLKGFVFAGPAFSYCVSSTTQIGGSIGSIGGSTGKTDNFASGNGNRFDVMVGGGAGVDYNDKIRFSVSYDFGMLNRTQSETVIQNRNVLKAGIAFLF